MYSKPVTNRRIFGAYSVRLLAFAVSMVVAFAVFVGCSPTTTAPTDPTNSRYQSTSTGFLTALLQNTQTFNYQPSANFNIPAIWLFAPNGNLVSVTTDAAKLPSLTGAFPPQSTEAMPNQPSLKAMNKVLSDATASEVSLQKDPALWTALLFTGKNPECKHCSMFESAAEDLQRAQKQVHLAVLDVQ